MKPDITDAISELTDQPFGWDGGEDCIVWPNTNTGDAPTRAEMDAKLVELMTAWTAQEYARNRATAYPSTGDQLDMIYKDMKNSTTTHADAVEVVKTKYPKG